MAKNNYQERKEQRIERYEDLAEKNKQKANQYSNSHSIEALRGMAGEPIKIGHHSEKRHRKLQEKAFNDMSKAVEHSKKAEYYEDRARSAENNSAISSDDNTAIQQIEEKLKELKEQHEKIKSINAEYRKVKGDVDKMTVSDKLKASIKKAQAEWSYSATFKPIPQYMLANSNQNIKRYEKRLEELKAQEQDETKEIQIGDITIIDNVEMNRVQILFPGKPSEEIRQKLKQHGFKWAPSQKAWQRHRSNVAMWKAEQIANEVTRA